MESRIGVIGIVLDDPKNNAERVNSVIGAFAGIIKGRIGLPFPERNEAVISLIVEGGTDEIGALSGKLGQLAGVSVKSALTSKRTTD